MRKIALYIGFFLLFGPQIALAQAVPCSSQGYTVVYVNGVLDTLDKAKADNKALKDQLGPVIDGEPINVQLGYNPSHLSGLGDLGQSVAQELSYSVSDYDLQTILMQIYPEVTTRKLLLVGHSQGAYYTNEMYNYLLAHGEPKEALAVYDVGTPAPQVAGGGKYLNSSSDLLLTFLHDMLHFNELPSNIFIPLAGTDITSLWPGHSFVNAYLAGASDRIVSDISGELSVLTPTDSTNTGGCFTPPDSTLGYKTQRAIFAVADPTAVMVKNGTVAGAEGVVAVGNAVSSSVATAFNFISNALPAFSVSVTNSSVDETNFKILKKLYGSSVDAPITGDSQGSAVALALTKEKPVAVGGGFVEGTSTDASNVSNFATSSVASISIASTSAPTHFVPAASSPTPWVSGGNTSADDTVVDATTTDDSATSTPDIDATTTPDTSDASTTPDVSDPPPAVSGYIISSQLDSSGTPSHYWHSDSSAGAFLILDPNDGQPGYSIGNITTADTNVVGIHIKVQFNANGGFATLPRIPLLFDESGTHAFACAQMPIGGVAYPTAEDALALTNPIQFGDYNGNMIDMYFQCNLGAGHDQVFANTSYRLFLSPISSTDVTDIFVAMNAAGTEPYYELSDDGSF